MTSTSLPAVGDVIGGRYKIQSIIATGGMGVVMRGQHVKMGREVAVKFLHSHLIQDTDIRQRFEREVDIAKDLTHPNVVHVYDYGETPAGNLYLVMEYLEGNDLKHVLKQERRFNAGRSLNIMMQLLDGLAEAHIRNVVHRDLKPANLFMTTDRHGNDLVKILDFGIAKSLQADQGITKAGTLCGTVAYMAPEAILSGGDTPSCDVYAAGLILLEMLTGKRAFRGETVAQTMMMQLQQSPFIPPRLEQTALGRLIKQATDKNQEGRFRDADSMLLALRQTIHQIDPNFILTDEEVPFSESDAAPSRSDIYQPKPVPTIPIPQASSNTAATPSAAVITPAADATIEETFDRDASTQHITLDDLEWQDVLNANQPGNQNESYESLPDDLRPTVQLDQPPMFFNEPVPTPIPRTRITSQPGDPSSNLSVEMSSSSSTSTSLSYEQPAGSRKPVFMAVAALLGVAVVAGGIFVATGSKSSDPVSEAPQIAAIAPKPTEFAALEAQNEPPTDAVAENPLDPPTEQLVEPADDVQEFAVNIQTAPDGADLFLDNFPIGQSPLTIKLKPDEMPAELRIVLEGYVDNTQLIDNTSADTLRFELEPVPAPPEIVEEKNKPKDTSSPVSVTTTTKPTTAPKKPPVQKAPAKEKEPATPNVDDLLNKYLD